MFVQHMLNVGWTYMYAAILHCVLGNLGIKVAPPPTPMFTRSLAS